MTTANALLDTLYFSDPLGLNRPVEKEASALYEEYRGIANQKLPVFGKISLVMSRMYAAYALYLVRQQQGHPRADQLLAEIARLDPYSQTLEGLRQSILRLVEKHD